MTVRLRGQRGSVSLLVVVMMPALLAAAGAVSFVFSDTLIGINRFVLSFEAAPYLLIVTYWLGQWGITASAFHQTTRASEGQVG